MEKERTGDPERLSFEDIISVLNSLFRAAEVGVTIIDFEVSREEVVIGFTEQVESFEDELKTVGRPEGLLQPGRYIAIVRLSSGGRELKNVARFYRRRGGALVIEDIVTEEVTLTGEEEINKPDRWQGVIKFARSITEVILKALIEVLLKKSRGEV